MSRLNLSRLNLSRLNLSRLNLSRLNSPSHRRTIALACLAAAAFTAAPAIASPPASNFTLAQAQQQSQDRTRISGRSSRGMIKLAIGAGVALVAGGGWVLRKIRGEDD
jgi:hypothetical protein